MSLWTFSDPQDFKNFSNFIKKINKIEQKLNKNNSFFYSNVINLNLNEEKFAQSLQNCQKSEKNEQNKNIDQDFMEMIKTDEKDVQ